MKIYHLCLALLAFGCWQHNPAGQQTQPTEAAQPVAVAARSVSPGTRLHIDFEEAAVGALPAGWSADKTGSGEEKKWAIAVDGNNKVLAQLATTNPNSHFNVATLDTISAKNVQLKTRFKAISGRKDQGGGFVWRYRDAQNYYIVRANPLENNVVLYKVENGKRTDLPLIGKGRTYGADAKVPTKTWNQLEVEAQDDLFTVRVNGKELFQVKDATFPQAGRVGFWTKADAVTYFDDLEISVLP
jgi:Domain of Unknown Function (DUF1080)